MSQRVRFAGRVVRMERDGFGVVQFDDAIGANTHGIFSQETSDPGLPFERLKRGAHVTGTAEVDEHAVAAVKTIEIASD
jgi:hypothetical protein